MCKGDCESRCRLVSWAGVGEVSCLAELRARLSSCRPRPEAPGEPPSSSCVIFTLGLVPAAEGEVELGAGVSSGAEPSTESLPPSLAVTNVVSAEVSVVEVQEVDTSEMAETETVSSSSWLGAMCWPETVPAPGVSAS